MRAYSHQDAEKTVTLQSSMLLMIYEILQWGECVEIFLSHKKNRKSTTEVGSIKQSIV